MPSLGQKKLKELRMRLGLTQKMLADKLGLTAGAIFYWESGVQAPRAKSYAKLVKLGKKAKIKLNFEDFSTEDDETNDDKEIKANAS